MSKIIGIDLGTTNSVAAYMEGNKPVVIPNDIDENLTPSVVCWNKNNEIIVGNHAKNQAVTNPEKTIHSIKRRIGTNEKLTIGRETFTPEEVSSLILRKIRQYAESYIGEKIEQAVITVPAYFNDNQRQATVNASKIIGLEAVRIINEPTAAALAYGLNKDADEQIVVFDIGGGTYDISILEIGDGVFQVLATSGDNFLGGDDFDKDIMDFIINEFYKKEKIDIKNDKMVLQRIKEEAIRVKIALSSQEKIEISLPFLTADSNGPIHFSYEFSRSQFEQLLENYRERIIAPVEDALADAGLDKNEIHRVILVGGSTRIPKIQQIIQDFFDNAKIEKSINPDECVALGAAIQASMLQEDSVTDLVLVDVTPFSLGVEVENKKMSKIIEKNSNIPVSAKKMFTTMTDNQSSVEIKILQGESEISDENELLGIFELKGIEYGPAGSAKIEVEFDIDVNGIVIVTAKDLTTNKQQQIEIKNSKQLSDFELQRLKRKAKKYDELDEQNKEKQILLNKLKNYEYECQDLQRKENENTKELFLDFKNLLNDISIKIEEGSFEEAKEILDAAEFMLNEIKSLASEG